MTSVAVKREHSWCDYFVVSGSPGRARKLPAIMPRQLSHTHSVIASGGAGRTLRTAPKIPILNAGRLGYPGGWVLQVIGL